MQLPEMNEIYLFIPWLLVKAEIQAGLVLRARRTAPTGRTSRAREFLGLEPPDWHKLDLGPEFLAKIDLRRFPAPSLIERAYSYAYQIGDERARAFFHDGGLSEAQDFHEGLQELFWEAGYFPLAVAGVLLTAATRLRLQDGWFLDVEELALLSGLEVADAEAALRAEGLISDEEDLLDTD